MNQSIGWFTFLINNISDKTAKSSKTHNSPIARLVNGSWGLGGNGFPYCYIPTVHQHACHEAKFSGSRASGASWD